MFGVDNLCDQIGRFIGLWASFQSLWQQLVCPKLPHSEAIFKGVKMYHFSCEIIFRHLAIVSGHTLMTMDQQRNIIQELTGGGGGPVFSVLAFYSVNPSSNPTEVYDFYSVNCLKRTKINKKEAGNGPFLKRE